MAKTHERQVVADGRPQRALTVVATRGRSGYGPRLARIAVIGSFSVDHVRDESQRAGGAPFHAGVAAAHLGADAVVVARCAPVHRDLCVPPLERLGVSVRWRAAATSAEFAFHYDGGHRVMEVRAVGDPWLPADVGGWAAPGLQDAEWVQVGALLRTDFPAATLAALARGGRRILLDGQGLVRRARVGPLEHEGVAERSVLEHVTALKLSESEARALVGSVDLERLLGLGVPEVLVTLGDRGSLVLAGDTMERVAVEPARADADPTGAGDALSLAYMAARAAGAAPLEAARSASGVVTDFLAAR